MQDAYDKLKLHGYLQKKIVPFPFLIQLLYKAKKPSVLPFISLSVCTFWNTHNSVISALIKTGLDQNESCVFEDCKVYFYKSTGSTVYQQKCVKDESISTKQPLTYEVLPVSYLAGGWSPTLHVFYFS